jgi:putative phosphoesterase
MKIIIASDIHGSAKYCRQLLEEYKREKAEKLLLLGDILYHGPRNPLPEEYSPKDVVAMLSELKEQILCVCGNCDSEVDQMVLPFPILPHYAVVFVDGLNIYLSHGHRAVPPLQKGDVYITGHTHVPLNVKEGEYYHLNPGSTSLPKENSGHGYIVYENRTFTFKTFEGGSYDVLKL